MEYCKDTGKLIYNSKRGADLVIIRKKRKQKTRRRKSLKPEIKESCSYQCPHCGHWHLAGK